MALDVNGYNSRFRSFVEFAQQRVDANDAKAVIDAKIQQPLGGRKILAVTQSRTDEVHKFVSFATALAGRLDAERAGMSVTPDGGPPADGESPAFDPGLISV